MNYLRNVKMTTIVFVEVMVSRTKTDAILTWRTVETTNYKYLKLILFTKENVNSLFISSQKFNYFLFREPEIVENAKDTPGKYSFFYSFLYRC